MATEKEVSSAFRQAAHHLEQALAAMGTAIDLIVEADFEGRIDPSFAPTAAADLTFKTEPIAALLDYLATAEPVVIENMQRTSRSSYLPRARTGLSGVRRAVKPRKKKAQR